LLGVVTIEPSEALVLNVPLDADAATIAAAEAEKVAAQTRESRRLRETFLEAEDR
jgi:hypothetical protein